MSAPPAMTAVPSPLSNSEPIVAPPPPWYLRCIYLTAIWAFKAVMGVGISLSNYIHPLRSPCHPIVKIYPYCRSLKSQVFIPPPNTDDPATRHPVYFSMHGGGWLAGSPDADDSFSSEFCTRNKIIVASLDYRKAPSHKFPAALTDIVALVTAVLEDDSLPIDTSRVAIGGFSAGGNLAFAACQAAELKGRIAAVVGFYPALDLTEPRELKESRRPKGRDVPKDKLGWAVKFVDWAYVPQGHNRRDPLLSPRYAGRDVFPRHVYLVGAEWDMLCSEAEATAESLAAKGERRQVGGSGWDGWVQGGVRWECFRKKEHAFMEVRELWSKSKEKERVRLVEELCDRVGVWLKEKAWASADSTEIQIIKP